VSLVLDEADRLEFLGRLEKTLIEYVEKQQHALKLEYDFLSQIMKHQGVSSAGRVSANMDKLKGLAHVQELFPTFLLGKYRKEAKEAAVEALPKEA
tara:strand:+ start:984 stop:1271 length:288 start_codon:yes stop_codon:yes gene_type:complete